MNLLPLDADERIQAVIDTRTYEDGSFLFFATKNGMVKKTKMQEYDSPLARNGLIAINLQQGDELVRVDPDHRRERHLPGVGGRHDHPLLRERRALDGPGHRRACGA